MNSEVVESKYFRAPSFYLTLLLFFGINYTYFLTIIGSVDKVVFCCDASNYVYQSINILTDGLVDDRYIGYRSYLNFFLTYIFRMIGSSFGYSKEIFSADLENGIFERSAAYSVGAIFFFISFGCIIAAKFYKQKGFWYIFIPLFMNPILFAQVPYPLQEGQAITLLVPLAAWALLAFKGKRTKEVIVSAGLLAGSMWMIKPSFMLISIFIFIFIFMFIWAEKETLRDRFVSAGVALVVAAIPVIPQVYSMYSRYSTLDPYPTKSFISFQLAVGWGMWRYDTVYLPEEKRFAGLPFLTPFGGKDPEKFELSAAIAEAPREAIILAIGHVLSSFNFSNVKTYEVHFSKSVFSMWNVLVGSIIFLGLCGSVLSWLGNWRDISGILVDGMIYGGAAALPFLAVETRFTLMPFAFLSVRVFDLARQKLSHRELAVIILGWIVFVAAFMFICALSLQTIQPGLI